jgi:hypothetical protein
MKASQASISVGTDTKRKIIGTATARYSDLCRNCAQGGPADHDENLHKQWKLILGAQNYDGKIYVPADDFLWNRLISLCHVNRESGNIGSLRTAEVGS